MWVNFSLRGDRLARLRVYVLDRISLSYNGQATGLTQHVRFCHG